MRYKYWITLVASVLLGLVFISSGVGKLLGQNAFLLSIASAIIVPPVVADIIATWLPWVELITGLALLAGVFTQLAALVSAVLAAVFTFHNVWLISHGLGYQPCGCLGVLDKLFGGKLSTINALYIDIGLLVLAVVIYFLGPGKFFNLRPWYWRRSKAAEPVPPVTQG